MYGGLFGDLPAAKGQQRRNDDQSTSQTATTAATKSSGATMYDSISTQREDVKSQSSTATMFVPPTVKKPKTSMGSGASTASTFSQTIGAAGTSMAFVPTTVKRKKSRFAKLLESPKVVPASDVQPQVPKVASASNTTPAHVAPFFSTTTTTTTSLAQAPLTTGPIDIHGTQQSIGGPAETGSKSTTVNSHFQSPQQPMDRLAVNNNTHDNLNSFVVEEEEEEVAEITDPYDPYVPNDLLQYWDRQALIHEQRQLEEETKQALEQQRILREQLERERQELQKQGNLTQLVGGLGRGRGRGVSNLPAWLVAQQEQQKEDGIGK